MEKNIYLIRYFQHLEMIQVKIKYGILSIQSQTIRQCIVLTVHKCDLQIKTIYFYMNQVTRT